MEPSEKFSFSTNAMIAFASGLAIGRIRDSVLAPSIRRATAWRPQREELRDNIGTCIDRAMDAILAESARLQRDANDSGKTKFRVESPLTESKTFGWDDPFTLTWIIEALRTDEDEKRQAFRDALLTRAQQRARASLSELAPRHDAILQISPDSAVQHAFPLLRMFQLGTVALGDDFFSQEGIGRARELLLNRVHRGLSESQIADSGFDAGDLVFSLEGYVLSSARPDLSLVSRVFDVLAEAQLTTPYWRPLRPFMATRAGLVLLPQSVEIANALLRICSYPSIGFREYFSNRLPLLQRYSQWLRGRVFRGATDDERQFIGWESEHTYTLNRIHLWQTSQALIFLQHYVAMLREHVARTLQLAAPLEAVDPRADERMMDWQAFRSSDPFQGGAADSPYHVYRQLESEFLVPRATEAENSPTPLYSALLYGPPGTGESTIAAQVARELRFEVITVTPSDFLTAGGEAVEARAKAIFRALSEQYGVVILFDEIDHLLLDRDSELYRRQDSVFQLLTPGMLTKLNALAKQRTVIFVIATNYLERIDPAVKRAGRIDTRLLVLPPDSARREAKLRERVQGFGELSKESRKALVAETALFTYRELDDLAAFVERQPAVAGADLATLLKDAIRRRPAMLSPAAYKSRLEDVGSREGPLEEFALVTYLSLEPSNYGFPTTPDDWVTDALVDAIKKDVVKDASVVAALRQAVVEQRGEQVFEVHG